MKRIVLFLIICSFLTQASIKTIVFIDWKINQARITELYCVNKNNPMMHCNGKCYLSQQLKKIEADYEQSKAPFNPKNLKATEVLLFIENFVSNPIEIQHFKKQTSKGGIYKESTNQLYLSPCFHPPNSFSSSALTA